MGIKVYTNISNEYKDIEIVINAQERTDEVIKLENKLINEASNNITELIGTQENNIFIIKVKDVIKFYSEEKNNYCNTKDGTFKIKEKLYYLEDKLSNKDFIRISNSEIININYVKCFNTGVIGSILIKFKDDSETYVSRRKVSDVMRFLKERRN